MIPTMMLVGLVLGRWWRLSLLVGALAWPAMLVVTGVMGFEPRLVVAAALGVANTAVGVLIHQVVLKALRLSPLGRTPHHVG